MSWQASAWAKERIKDLSAPYDKLMLMVLAEYAHPESHEAWPTQATLAEVLGTSERQVRRAIRSLEATGLIAQIQKGNQYQSSLYRLDVRGFQMSAAQVDAPVISASDTVSPAPAPDNPDQVHRTKSTSAPDSPVTSNLQEPSLEPTLREKSTPPEWFTILERIPEQHKAAIFDWSIDVALAWFEESGVSEERAVDTALALEAKWGGEGWKWHNVRPTFQQWVKRPPLNLNGTGPGRSRRQEARGDPKDFEGEW